MPEFWDFGPVDLVRSARDSPINSFEHIQAGNDEGSVAARGLNYGAFHDFSEVRPLKVRKTAASQVLEHVYFTQGVKDADIDCDIA